MLNELQRDLLLAGNMEKFMELNWKLKGEAREAFNYFIVMKLFM
jgi:hypothetical protein